MTINTLFQTDPADESPDKLSIFQDAFHNTTSHKKNGKTRDRSKSTALVKTWKKILAKTEEGRYILKFAKENNIKIAVDQKTKLYGYYSPGKNLTVINGKSAEGEAVGTLLHEMRHAVQHKNGFWCSGELSPRDNILMSCGQEADAESFCVMASWKLKMAGYPQAFEEHKKSGYGDISRRFEKMVTENPGALEDGSAMRAAYDQWFKKPGRVITYAAGTLEMVTGCLLGFKRARQKGFIPLTHDKMKDIGVLPNGSNYQAADNRNLVADEYRRIPHPDLVELLEIVELGIGITPPPSNDNKPAPESTANGDIREQLRQIRMAYEPSVRR